MPSEDLSGAYTDLNDGSRSSGLTLPLLGTDQFRGPETPSMRGRIASAFRKATHKTPDPSLAAWKTVYAQALPVSLDREKRTRLLWTEASSEEQQHASDLFSALSDFVMRKTGNDAIFARVDTEKPVEWQYDAVCTVGQAIRFAHYTCRKPIFSEDKVPTLASVIKATENVPAFHL